MLEWWRGAAFVCCVWCVAHTCRCCRHTQVIHEFDPYFNFRTTKYLASEGFYDFLNWFDDRAWYPLGRIIGGTIYPGLMATAAVIHNGLHMLSISINTRNMCVFLAPIFAALTAIATYLFTKEVRGCDIVCTHTHSLTRHAHTHTLTRCVTIVTLAARVTARTGDAAVEHRAAGRGVRRHRAVVHLALRRRLVR
jgi:hypothetical protein